MDEERVLGVMVVASFAFFIACYCVALGRKSWREGDILMAVGATPFVISFLLFVGHELLKATVH